MATEDQFLNAGRGLGSRTRSSQLASMTMAAGATKKAQVIVPAGAWLRGVGAEVATAFSGSPTNINLSVGTTDGGVDIVAAVDLKAQGHTTTTIVAAFDKVGAFTVDTTVYLQIVAVGGTNPAGTLTAFVDYDAPVR